MIHKKAVNSHAEEGIKSRAEAMAVPSGRGSRLVRLGWMATGIAAGMLAEGARQLAQGNRPKIRDLLLTPANARRMTDQLAKLRGAAMKVGQLLSMESGDLLPPALSEILSRLRSDARSMPTEQIMAMLDSSWGKGWETRFSHFSFDPVAAASIGQVHRALTLDGRDLAIKIQYPGVRESIDSDVDNVAGLLRLSGLLPQKMDITPLLRDAKRQLHDESDYLKEGSFLQRYGDLLVDAPAYVLPKLHSDLTTQSVLAMDYVAGEPIESLMDAPQPVRDRVMKLLFELLLREVFEFRLVQTDPNFANYRYDTATGQIILLDFGATRSYKKSMSTHFRQLIKGAMLHDRNAMRAACLSIGYFEDSTQERHIEAVLDIGVKALEPFCDERGYNFGDSDLPERVRSGVMALGTDREFWTVPPTDAMLLERKFGGLYLLAIRLKARVQLYALAQETLFSRKRSPHVPKVRLVSEVSK
jgi:predicted unusual protein kinase regulating ubiquinone biosynthesis (AarF/ABC1/UbiB family)